MRLTKDRVSLEFESRIHQLGFRTETSRAGEPPYYALVSGEGGYEIDHVSAVGLGKRIVGPMTLRDMHFLLEGIALGDRLNGKRAASASAPESAPLAGDEK